jgi:uncharacterized protein (TIGR00661 family)
LLNRRPPKILVFASDEGFGHIVRQEAVIKEILARYPKAQITVQTNAKIMVMREKFGDRIRYRDRYNNLNTVKTEGGGLDVSKTLEVLLSYEAKAQAWIERELKEEHDFDFYISDFVPEAFRLAKLLKKPAFGVAHFTWDWFFEILYPFENKRVDLLSSYIREATRLFFPPLTPAALLAKYGNLKHEVPFVINDFDSIALAPTDRFRCLVMDNGTSTLRRLIESSIGQFAALKDVLFYLSVDGISDASLFEVNRVKNIVPIRGLKVMHSHIPKMDFILARGGFNTLTESLISKVPALLVEEGGNPEVRENIRLATEKGLASSFSTSDFGPNFAARIRLFLKEEMQVLRASLNRSNFSKDGPAEIVTKIEEEVNKFYG